MLKRFGKDLKSFYIRKKIKNPTVNKSDRDLEQATFINVKDTPEEEVVELKNEVKNTNNDIVASVYKVYGPSAFLYDNVGSTYMGMSVLMSSKYEENDTRKQDNRKLVLKHNGLKSKTYKFNRFNRKSVKTITESLNRRYILNSSYLSSIYRAGQIVVKDNVVVKGRAGISGAQKTTVRYKYSKKMSSKNKVLIDINARKESEIKINEHELESKEILTESEGTLEMPVISIREKMADYRQEVITYHERVQDSKWAVLAATSNDADMEYRIDIKEKVEEIRSASSSEILVQSLVDKGEAVKLNEDVFLVFGDVNQLENETEEERQEKIIDATLIKTAIKFNTSVEELEIQNNEEVQKEIFSVLSENGIFDNNLTEDNRLEYVSMLEEEKSVILTEKLDRYVQIVAQDEIAKEVQQEIKVEGHFGETRVKTEKVAIKFGENIDAKSKVNEEAEIEEYPEAELEDFMNYSGMLSNVSNKWYETINNKMKEQLKLEVENVVNKISPEKSFKELVQMEKENVINSLNGIKDVAVSEAKTIAEYFDISEEDAEKVKEIKDKLKETVVNSEGKSKKKKDESNDNGGTVKFLIFGEVMLPGWYELPKGKNIWDAIKVAGGPTDEADLSKMDYYRPIIDEEQIEIWPILNEEDIFEECRPIIQKIIDEYIRKEEISKLEILNENDHIDNMIYKSRQKLRDKNITRKQIERLIKEDIERRRRIREILKNAKKNAKVIDTTETTINETKGISKERLKQEEIAENREKIIWEERFNRLKTAGTEESEEYKTNEKERLLKDLLERKDEQAELVERTTDTAKKEARIMYLNEINQRKYA